MANVIREVLFLTLMIKQFVNKIADNTNKQSLSHRFRNKRFEFFLSKLKQLPKPLSILDIGGTVEFWEAMQFNEPDITITLLNLEAPPIVSFPFKAIQGDATNLSSIANKSFDLVFSNSVIEHLFTWENQQKMASEILRVGKWHFIQTPNYWFPIEPHWVFPCFQYLPKTWKIWLTNHFNLGHIPKQKDLGKAQQQVEEIRLLTKQEMKLLFPNSAIYCEKFLGLNKSFVAYFVDNQDQ
jgi:2-polyprenyl-3-methyl-5-hydroxy-6-metoxy-1,4-benzoquinol methylase